MSKAGKIVTVTVEKASKNFSAYIEELPGCITTGKNIQELEANMREAVKGHLEVCKEYGDKVPKVFEGHFQLVFRFAPAALLALYSGVFTKAALERITGINQRQLWHYASGEKKPRAVQKKRIEAGLHKLGKELMSIEL